MMKRCIKCGKQMAENYKIGSNGLRIITQGFLMQPIAEIKCAVCPGCGYVELYINDTKNFNEILDKKRKSKLKTLKSSKQEL